nr:CheB methylesterase domain-containing protein [Sabulibacter ruber]
MSTLREFVGRFSDTSSTAQPIRRREVITDTSVRRSRALLSTPTQKDGPLNVVVIGASTGGSAAIEVIVRSLSVPYPTVILVAVHMPDKFTKRLARRLQKLTRWRVEEGFKGMKLSAGTIVIAPGGQNMRVRKKTLRPDQLTLDLEPSFAMDTPSVDILMESAAQCANSQVLGVILTGMGQDGTAGAREIMKRGGVVIAQNEESSTIFGMAKSAIENGAVHGVFALGQINSIINRFAADRHMSHALQRKFVG